MGSYLGGLIIGRIFASEIRGLIFGSAYFILFYLFYLFYFFGVGRGRGGGGCLLSEFYGRFPKILVTCNIAFFCIFSIILERTLFFENHIATFRNC